VKELLERERELAAVEELLGRRSGVLIIEVGVGIGKTSLVQAACPTGARAWLRRFERPGV
jgi:chromosomal replication initiation ATPase DnaA